MSMQDPSQLSSELAVTQTQLLDNYRLMENNNDPFIFAITIFILACFVGYYVVWKVTPALHTPLMSITNAISGIVIISAIFAAGSEYLDLTSLIGYFAVFIAAINIFGGFVVTQRMLEMFKKKQK